MIVIPKPISPPPVMVPSSDWVKPNCVPQSLRIAPRTENPMPAASSVAKLAQNRRLSLELSMHSNSANDCWESRLRRGNGEIVRERKTGVNSALADPLGKLNISQASPE